MRGFESFWYDVEKAKYFAHSDDCVIIYASEGRVPFAVWLHWGLLSGEMSGYGKISRVWFRLKGQNTVSKNTRNL